jgi:hypothetical protein
LALYDRRDPDLLPELVRNGTQVAVHLDVIAIAIKRCQGVWSPLMDGLVAAPWCLSVCALWS